MFKTPIQYLSKKNKLSPNTIADLQLDVLYSSLLDTSDSESESESEPISKVRQSWLDTYTTDTTFLKETQGLLSELSASNTDKTDISGIKKLYFDIKNNKGFCEKYNFITLDYFKNLNSNPYALQLIGMYSLTSPILALLTPILLMIIPFFIIRLSGQKMELSIYWTELKNVLSNLPIGKLFNIREASSDQRGFILFSAILYCVQLYQNTVDCYKFYKNSRSIVNDLHLFGNYFGKTAATMKTLSEKCPPSYEMFNTTLQNKLVQLQKLSSQYCSIKPNMFTDIGMKMKLYYDIHNDIKLQELIEYSFDFHEYESNMKRLATIESMHPCDFHPSKTSFSKSFHGILRNERPQTNSYSLTDTNYILSGPNASGKTTMLKSTVINIILSQQHGKGFYQKAKIAPYHHFHCYINIPDTCDRDSLFQAEARRCHDILRCIQQYPQERHLCVFDELFSGTNPHEAEAAAVGYLQYLTKNANVRFILTTHYLKVCEHFKKNKLVKNFTLERKYKLSVGISRVRGGIAVLSELEFPKEILDTAKKMLSFD